MYSPKTTSYQVTHFYSVFFAPITTVLGLSGPNNPIKYAVLVKNKNIYTCICQLHA